MVRTAASTTENLDVGIYPLGIRFSFGANKTGQSKIRIGEETSSAQRAGHT